MKINRMKNVFGINAMTSGTDNLSNSCIYASNGLFKTSLARLLFYLSRKDFSEIKDRVGNKLPEFDIEISNVKFTEDILERVPNDEERREYCQILLFFPIV